MSKAYYYHTRYIQYEVEPKSSSVRRIANEVLMDYENHHILRNSDDKNLNGLFI